MSVNQILSISRARVCIARAIILVLCLGLLGLAVEKPANAFTLPPPASTSGFAPGRSDCNNSISIADRTCNLCIQATPGLAPGDKQASTLGFYMIEQIFEVINQILAKLESSFYTGIIGSSDFQKIMGVAFILYIAMYGLMITLNLASYRTGEVSNRLIKLAIVYAMTNATAWTFFSSWLQTPVIGTINQLIVDLANAGAGSGRCVSNGDFSSSALIVSGGSSSSTYQVQLATGPMAMLYGPMSCIFAANFFVALEAMFTLHGWGWILGIIILWGMLEFCLMLLGALITYIKSIVGLTFLFALAPIFFAFFLFEKTRKLTEGWFSMVLGFALQPIMLFAFLAFYATIIGTAADGMFVDGPGEPSDVCYVPWFTMPGLSTVYWWKFINDRGVAGGQFLNHTAGADFGKQSLPSVAQISSYFFFLVLCNLGRGFARYINELCITLTGGAASAVTTGEEVGNWIKNNFMGGRNPASIATEGLGKGGNMFSKLLVGKRSGLK